MCNRYFYSLLGFNLYQKEPNGNSEMNPENFVHRKIENDTQLNQLKNSSRADLISLNTKIQVANLKENVQEKIFAVHQLFDWEQLDVDDTTLSRLQIMANPDSWSAYLNHHDEYFPNYKTITNYNHSTREQIEEKIKQDPVLCASFAVAVAEGIAEGANTTIPTSGGATWELAKVLPQSHYNSQEIDSFDHDTISSLPNGTLLTAQYNGSNYKDYGPTHSMVLVNMQNGKKGLLHLFHTSIILTPLDEIQAKGNSFSFKIADQNTGFKLVSGSSLIIPNYQTEQSIEKRKNNPRKRYTIQSKRAMSAYQFAEGVAKTLRIPIGAANMIVLDQNNISSLDQLYTNMKVTTLGRKQPLSADQENSLSFTDSESIPLEAKPAPTTKITNTSRKTEKQTEKIKNSAKSQETKTPQVPSQKNPSNTYQSSPEVQKMYGNEAATRRRG